MIKIYFPEVFLIIIGLTTEIFSIEVVPSFTLNPKRIAASCKFFGATSLVPELHAVCTVFNFGKEP